jgi:hypothetical protein
MWQFGGAGQATDCNTAHALRVLDIKSYRHTDYETFIAFPQQKCLQKLV